MIAYKSKFNCMLATVTIVACISFAFAFIKIQPLIKAPVEILAPSVNMKDAMKLRKIITNEMPELYQPLGVKLSDYKILTTTRRPINEISYRLENGHYVVTIIKSKGLFLSRSEFYFSKNLEDFRLEKMNPHANQ